MEERRDLVEIEPFRDCKNRELFKEGSNFWNMDMKVGRKWIWVWESLKNRAICDIIFLENEGRTKI